MYETILKLLRRNGVKIDRGLSEGELKKIKEIYHFSFPYPMQCLLLNILPVSSGFYNWRDFSNENIVYIKNMMRKPFEDVYSLAKEVYWCDNWGEEPKKESDRVNEVRKRLERAPALLPIFSHRYMPLCGLVTYPILSIHGADIIYYGNNIENYIQIEFGDKKQEELDFQKIEYVPFWTDLM